MPFLIVERGNEKGRRIDVDSGRTIVFGRDPDCDLATTDHLCSPRHFEIFEKDGGWFLRDLDSEHGTYVNEERVPSKLRLRQGDTIHAGETQLSFSLDDAQTGRGPTTRVLGGYRILERIGRGGMGAVYKANQVSLNRIVALKILSRRISSDPAFVKRFQSEAQAAGRLNHPNIVQVYDVGFDQGVHYYSMEYIENGSVQDLATRMGVLDIDLALGIATDAARGLVYAEKRGLVHRDIKPDNLMINSEGVVKIADLGLALDAGERARHAGEGSKDEEDVFGTPQFISPEQAQGLAVDTRSDIYSLGASLYRLVTGQPPFTGENIPEIIQKQVHDQPVPVRKLRPECPPAIAAAIERAMQKEPSARFQTAQELLEALEAADDASKGRRSKGLLVGAAVATLAVVAGAAYFLTRPKDEPRPVAPAPESRPDTRAASDAGAIASIQRERDAARALREAIDFEKDAIAGGNPDLAAVRARYDSVASRFPDTPDGREAATHATTLAARIAEEAARADAAREAAESRARAAETTATRARADAARLAEADRVSEALQLLRRARTEVAGTDHEAAIDGAIAQTIERADARATEVLAASAAAEASGGDPEKILSEAADAFEASPFGVDASVEPHARRLREALDESRARRESKRRADVAHDAVVIDRARKELHRGLVNAFDPDAAVAALDAAKAGLALPDSLAAIDRERALIDAIVRVRDRIVASLSAGEGGRGARVKLPGAADRKRLVDQTVLKADSKGLTIKRGAGEAAVPFSSLSAAEVAECLLADVVDKDAAVRADAITFLLFVGLPDRAAQIAESLPDGKEKLETLERVAREREAWAILANVRDLSQRAPGDDAALVRLYRQVARLIDGFRDTRAYLLNRRPPAEPGPTSRAAGR